MYLPLQVDSVPVVRLQLWRRDLLTGTIEMSDKLRVLRADPSVGLIMGVPHSMLVKQMLHRCVTRWLNQVVGFRLC